MSRWFATAVCVLSCSLVLAQSKPAPTTADDDERGFASYIQFGGSVNSSGRVFKPSVIKEIGGHRVAVIGRLEEGA